MSDERLYDDLAAWWPLLSPPEHYAAEARAFLTILAHARGQDIGSLLELGSGGGHLASCMPGALDLVLVDRAPAMLAASRALNPDRTHVEADMAVLDLGRTFDAVLLHDAVMYLTAPGALDAACATAARHLVPGGAFLVLPDLVADSFEESTVSGGTDAPDGRGARLLEWRWDPDPTDGRFRVDMNFLLREADGTVRAVHDVHEMALFERNDLWRAIRAAGLQPVEAPVRIAAALGSEVFLARKPA
ncbi:MAG: class I SAM-dependent methyltransferase [Alphaproteobacteria bacterium]|nr:class I SAM-dependent methyltransferase [Alphaproteobacteria bacterium]